jgi:hypothetical protein
MKGGVRGGGFDSVIGIGGIGSGAELNGIARKLTWIGIDKHLIKHDPNRPFVNENNPLVAFDHFRYFEPGLSLKDIAPVLTNACVRVSAQGHSWTPCRPKSGKMSKEFFDLRRTSHLPANGLNGTSTILASNAHQHLVADNSHLSMNRLAETEPLMRRQLEIFLSFMARTGHQHPVLSVSFGNYEGLLVAMGRSKAKARAAIKALARAHGVKL